ncbi:MAG: molybdate ABC transporter permease subunit, partial [Gammaproteobacteria bacterium]|nr:molybdate ABC transporter permease subunit [Gammaproteobacteria bacterium]
MDLGPLWLSVQLASITMLLLLLIGTPLGWWLARTRSRLRPVLQAIVALPIVLPPTVL